MIYFTPRSVTTALFNFKSSNTHLGELFSFFVVFLLADWYSRAISGRDETVFATKLLNVTSRPEGLKNPDIHRHTDTHTDRHDSPATITILTQHITPDHITLRHIKSHHIPGNSCQSTAPLQHGGESCSSSHAHYCMCVCVLWLNAVWENMAPLSYPPINVGQRRTNRPPPGHICKSCVCILITGCNYREDD